MLLEKACSIIYGAIAGSSPQVGAGVYSASCLLQATEFVSPVISRENSKADGNQDILGKKKGSKSLFTVWRLLWHGCHSALVQLGIWQMEADVQMREAGQTLG